MSKLIYVALGLCLTLSAAIFSTAVLGRRQPVADRIAALHLADCALPCWIGIVPGQMPLNDALDRLDDVFGMPRHKLSSSLRIRSVFVGLPLQASANLPTSLTVRFDAVDGAAARIVLPAEIASRSRLVQEMMPRLGEIVNVLGTPFCVLAAAPGVWDFIYKMPDGVVTLRMMGRAPQWSQPIYSLSMQAGYSNEVSCSVARPDTAWRGLISLDRYTAQ